MNYFTIFGNINHIKINKIKENIDIKIHSK